MHTRMIIRDDIILTIYPNILISHDAHNNMRKMRRIVSRELLSLGYKKHTKNSYIKGEEMTLTYDS